MVLSLCQIPLSATEVHRMFLIFLCYFVFRHYLPCKKWLVEIEPIPNYPNKDSNKKQGIYVKIILTIIKIVQHNLLERDKTKILYFFDLLSIIGGWLKRYYKASFQNIFSNIIIRLPWLNMNRIRNCLAIVVAANGFQSVRGKNIVILKNIYFREVQDVDCITEALHIIMNLYYKYYKWP